MSGILRLESLTKGNTLKQGDKTPLKYRLFDADGEKLNIAGKSAKVRLVYPDFLTIGYEKDGLTVAQDDTLTFTIDGVIPSRIYHVEIIVDDKFIFPSRADEAKFTVDKSSLGTETNIIEVVGVDQIVNKVLGQVDADIGQAITDITATNEAIQQAEQERVQGYQEIQQIIEDGSLNAEPKDGSVSTPKIVDNAVTPEKTSFISGGGASRNLFNKDTAIIGYRIDTADRVTLIEDSGFVATGYIQVIPGSTVYKNKVGGFYWYGSEKDQISGYSNNTEPMSFELPSDAHFVRANIRIYDLETFQIEYGTEETEYEEFGDKDAILSDTIEVTEGSLKNIQSLARKEDIISTVSDEIAKINIPDVNISDVKKPNLFRMDAPGDFTVFMPLGGNEYGGHRFLRDPREDFIKKYEESIYKLSDGTEGVMTYSLENYDYTNPSFNITGMTVSNQYTSTIGTIITHDFVGNEIYARFPTRYDGGLWKVSIDGIERKMVSVRKTDYPGIATVEFEIATDLASGNHTIELEFMGDDPESPATTSDFVTPAVARGWIKADVDGDRPESQTFRIGSLNLDETQIGTLQKEFDITAGFSNKEFAFEIAKDESGATQWFPSHMSIPTTNRGATGFQNLTLDGETFDLDTTTAEPLAFNKGVFTQYMEAKRDDDTEIRAIIKLVMTFENNKVHQFFQMIFKQDTFISNSYVFMVPALNDYLGQLVTDKDERIESDVINLGVNEHYTDTDVHKFIATSNFENMKDYYLEIDMEKIEPFSQLYLQHRGSGLLQKLYPKTHSKDWQLAGDILTYTGTYEIKKESNANLLYGHF